MDVQEVSAMKIDTPQEFLTKLFLGMTWDGPIEDIPQGKRARISDFAETVIRIAKRAD